MKTRRIIRNYLKTWFAIDAVVVLPDWAMIIAGSAGSGTSFGRAFKAARAVRVLRLLRIAKVQKIISMIYDMLDSEYSFIILSLARLLLFILVLNHVIACLW